MDDMKEKMERMSLYGVEANLILYDWLATSYADEKPIHKIMVDTCQFIGHPSNGRYCFCGAVQKISIEEAREARNLMNDLEEGSKMEETQEVKQEVKPNWRPVSEEDYQEKLRKFKREQADLYCEWMGRQNR